MIEKKFETKKERLFWNNLSISVLADKVETCYYQWTYAIWKNNGLSILPNKNMIANIGFNDKGTHTSGVDILGLSNMQTFPIEKIINHSAIAVNTKADKYTLDHYFNPSKLFYIYKKLFFLSANFGLIG